MTTIPPSKKICSVEGCDNTGKIVRGWCGKHYQRWQNHGDPQTFLRTLNNPVCSVEGCDTAGPITLGWCTKHYQRWRAHGDPVSRVPLMPREEWCAGIGDQYPGHTYMWQPTGQCRAYTKLCPEHKPSVVGLKTCGSCKEALPTNAFSENKRNKDGLQHECRPCKRRRSREWVESNPDKVRGYQGTRRAAKKTLGQVGKAVTWRMVAERDGMNCAYCKLLTDPEDKSWGSYGPTHPTLDHVVPLVLDGDHTLENVLLACGECNVSKNRRTLEQWLSAGGPPRLRR